MMISLRLAGVAALLMGAASAARAQDLFIGTANSGNVLTRGTDKNGNAFFNDVNEFTKAAFDSSKLGTCGDFKYTSFFGTPTLLWLDGDSSKKSLVKLTDTNGNGIFENSELTNIFTAFQTLIGATGSSAIFFGGLAVDDVGGQVWIANNQFSSTPAVLATNGLYRVNLAGVPTATTTIKNGDVISVYESTGVVGAAVANGGAWERVVRNNTTGTIYSYNTQDDVIYALTDLNSDGDFRDAGEVVNFLNAAGHLGGAGVSADFFGGALSSYGALFNAVVANSTGNRLTFLYLELRQSDGAVFIGTRTQTATGFTEPTAGKIFKAVDLNGNGTCNDAGEVTLIVSDSTGAGPVTGLFVDPATSTQYTPSTASPGWTGMGIDQATGELYAMSNEGPADPSGGFEQEIVWKFVDLDADGASNSVGEQLLVHFQRPSGSLSNELEVVSGGIFSPNFPAMGDFETGGTQSPITTTAACIPTTDFTFPPAVRFYKDAPYLGNASWQVSVTGISVGTTFAQLWVSEADWDPLLVGGLWSILGFPIPANPLSRNLDEWLSFVPVWMASSPMYLDILDLAGTGTFFLENVPGGVIKGAGGVAGGASYVDTINVSCSITPSGTAKYIGRFDCDLAIPNVPTLAGKTFRFQWHVQDPSGAGGFPRAVSNAGIIQLF